MGRAGPAAGAWTAFASLDDGRSCLDRLVAPGGGARALARASLAAGGPATTIAGPAPALETHFEG